MTEDEKQILQFQVEMLREEKYHRSRLQFDCVRLSLINVGVISFFGIFSVVTSGDDFGQRVTENATFVFALMCVLTVVSVTLFLFWIDHALTIGGIDRFLMKKEESIDKHGNLFWFEYRNQLNQTMMFKVKKHIFNLAVILSFISPPFLFWLFTALHRILAVPFWVQVAGGAAFFTVLIVPLMMWRSFTRRLYG